MVMAIYAMCSSDEWILVYLYVTVVDSPDASLPEYSTDVSIELLLGWF